MPVKLNKVLKDLNVGLQTVVDYLRGKRFEVESNPNVRIPDEQYTLLVKEFGKNLPESERSRLLEKAAPTETHVKPEPKPEPVAQEPTKTEPDVIKTEIPDDILPKFVTKGKIDLPETSGHGSSHSRRRKHSGHSTTAHHTETKPAAPAPASSEVEAKQETPAVSAPTVEAPAPSVEQPKEGTAPVEIKTEASAPTAQTQEAPAPIAEAPAEPAPTVAETPKPEASADSKAQTGSTEKKEDEVFRLETPRLESNIKVTGKIDLATINQSMRPKRRGSERNRDRHRPPHPPTPRRSVSASRKTASTSTPPSIRVHGRTTTSDRTITSAPNAPCIRR